MDPSPYLDRDTFLHRLDPRTKMFLLLEIFVLAFVFTYPNCYH
jgi:energy-coupling factor transport system permease protein